MTTNVAIATTAADSAAIEAIEHHHAQLLGALTTHVDEVVAAAMEADPVASAEARTALVRWCERELVPHAAAEEEALYPAAADQEAGRLLIAAMTGEHATIRKLVGTVSTADDPVLAAGAAMALRVVFDSHKTKENEQVLPLLAGAPMVSLAGLLDGMHGALAGSPADHEHDHDDEPAEPEHHDCACGEVDDGLPELDARVVPHAIRHATIFGALDAVRPGGGMVLVAPHDPLPLLAQVEERDPGAFVVEYLERGPEAWRLQFVRTA